MKPRVLHLITVYNGRAFVPRCIESAVRMDRSAADVDVLILDDASPEPGWSDELREICLRLGADYYCTPRNLGIPRNCSLGLATAIEKKYDYVTINNSDVIFPFNLITVMVEACQNENVGSVTAWSNNVSIYSIPNSDPDRFLASQEKVDWISGCLQAKYGNQVFDIPAGISFCIMMPIEVVHRVGFMDPIFGRGYCEETDWSLRSLAAGYRICLTPGAFVYHQGRGSNLAAGLVSGAHTSVPENEVIIDRRYPEFREQCRRFEATGLMPHEKGRAIDELLDQAAATYGFSICPAWDRENSAYDGQMQIVVGVEEEQLAMRYCFAGFEQIWAIEDLSALENAILRFDRANLRSNAFASADQTATGQPVVYPTTAW